MHWPTYLKLNKTQGAPVRYSFSQSGGGRCQRAQHWYLRVNRMDSFYDFAQLSTLFWFLFPCLSGDCTQGLVQMR